MFKDCSSLISLPDISKWNTFNSDDINNMFNGCLSLSFLADISKWKFLVLIDKSYLFDNCLSLIQIPSIRWKIKDNLNVCFQNIFKEEELNIFFQKYESILEDEELF